MSETVPPRKPPPPPPPPHLRNPTPPATPVRNSLPWLGPLLEWQPAEPALLPSGGQQIAQHQPRPQQPRLHRSNRDAQRLGRLLNIQMFHIAQHEDLAILSVQRTQRLRQPLPHLLALQRLGRNLAPVRKIPRRILALFIAATVASVVESFHGHCPLPSAAHESLIHRDLDEPRTEPRLRPKLPDIRESLQHRFLSRIFRVMLVTQNRQRCRVNPPLIRPHQLVKQFVLSTLHARNQIPLARASLHRILDAGIQNHSCFRHLTLPLRPHEGILHIPAFVKPRALRG